MTDHVICRGCLAAVERVQAQYAAMLFRNAIYSNECTSTFERVVEVARHVLQRSERRAKRDVRSHTCGGEPRRCETCGSPILLDRCPNAFCCIGISDDEWDRSLMRPGRPMDQVVEADMLIRTIMVPRAHHGGESIRPIQIRVTLDGEIYSTSSWNPTDLSDEEIMVLPTRSKSEVKVDDYCIGETRGHSPMPLPEQDWLSVGVSWWTAYERPASGERFRVYDHDGP